MSSGPDTTGSSIRATKKLWRWQDRKSGMMIVTSSPTGMPDRILLMQGLTPARMILWEETRPSWHLMVTLLSLWQLLRSVSILPKSVNMRREDISVKMRRCTCVVSRLTLSCSQRWQLSSVLSFYIYANRWCLNKPIKDGGSTAGLPPCNKPKDQQSN